jgi:tape measure domain-containing protein
VSKDSLEFSIDFNTAPGIEKINQLWRSVIAGSQDAKRELDKVLGGDTVRTLEFRIKADGGEAIIKERSQVDKLIQAYEKKNQVEAGSLTNLRQALNKAKQDRDQTAQFVAQAGQAYEGIAQKVAKISPEWAKQQAEVQRLEAQLNSAGGSSFWDRLKAGGVDLRGFLSAGNGLTQLVVTFQSLAVIFAQLSAPLAALEQALAKLQGFQLSFKAIGVGAGESQAALQETARVALGLGATLNTVRDGFQRLSPVILQSGGTLKDVSAITESLASRFAAFGTSADASRRIMNGVIQAFAKGKLQAEELTQQISEADPAFKVDFANALGVSVKKLEELVKAGEITTDVLIDILPEISKSSLLFGKLGTSAASAVEALRNGNATIEQVRNQLQTIGQLSLENLATIGEPLITAFIAIRASFTDFLASISRSEAVRSLIGLLGNLAQSIGVTVNIVLKVAEAFVFVAQPILQLLNALTAFQPVIIAIGAILAGVLVNAVISVGVAFKAAIAETVAITRAIKAAALEYANLGNSAKKAGADALAGAAQLKAASSVIGGSGGGKPAIPPPPPPVDPSVYQQAAQAAQQGAQQVATANAQIGASAVAASTTTKGAFSTLSAGVGSALVTAKASIAGFVTSLVGLLGPLIAPVAAVAAVGAAFDVYNGIMANAKATTESAQATIKSISLALQQQGVAARASGTQWDAAAQRLGAFGAFLDEIRYKLQALGINFLGATNLSASFTQQSIALTDTQKQVGEAISQLAEEYNILKTSGDQSAESLAKQNALYQALSEAVNGRIAQIDTEISQLTSLNITDEKSRQLRDLLITQLQEEKAKLEGVATATGLATSAKTGEIAVLNELVAKLREVAAARIESLNQQKAEVSEQYEAQLEKIQAVKTSERERFQALKQEIASAREASAAYYDAAIQRIRDVRDAERAVAAERIRGLQAATPAERELQKLRIQELQQQAARGGREGLEAKAQLERIEANERIAQIQEEERQKEEKAQARLKELENARKLAEKAYKELERKADIEHKEKMKDLDEQEAAIRKAKKEEERGIEREIREIKEDQKKATEEAAKATDGAAEAGGNLASSFGTAADRAGDIRKIMDDIKRVANSIRIPSTGNRFTGGDVSGGSRYTVNELGKEMFLSSSGRLSWINAPAWGQWTAPGAGTVIPAHVAAGINIPRGGGQVPRSVSGTVSTSGTRQNFSKTMVQLVNALNASRQSPGDGYQSMVQASQAAQIGKLTHAVNKLVEKEWSVGVNIRAENGGLTYSRAVNRRI